MNSVVGQAAALATAVLWTATALAFEYAGKRIGASALNFLRLLAGFLLLGLYGLVARGAFLPLDASAGAWLWLSASGIVGLLVGDLLLFQAFIDIGSRLSMLVYASAPALTAFLGFAFLGERLSPWALAGMGLTLAGIAAVLIGRPALPPRTAGPAIDAAPAGHRLRGLLLAAGGALGQAAGLILSKIGAGTGAGAMDPFAGTQIRVSAGLLGFGLVLLATGAWRSLGPALKDRKALAGLGLGAFFGPFLGVSLSLLAVQQAQTGVASAIMSITPVLIIAPSAILWKERVRAVEVLGSVLAVGGVALLFLI